ncbi:hypothetical protein [Planococcus lenghuensis]|uniref:Uncharacterized protein n=1 Tax=Planococcus lenghuensis TaxID=2213202 RepID=A0A1Q2KX87_9BACL|nr:hypothetical protein [Planococcus lenghuensis]AQQ52724.1 hypothetical protein B0X71_06165 [Planococcus lenghuensis]
MDFTILMPFLYFPEDKSEYIPAAIEFIAVMVIAAFVFRWVIKKSKRDEQKTKELEERILRERKNQQPRK